MDKAITDTIITKIINFLSKAKDIANSIFCLNLKAYQVFDYRNAMKIGMKILD